MAEEGRTERRLAVWGGLFGGRLNELANPLRGGSSSRLRWRLRTAVNSRGAVKATA